MKFKSVVAGLMAASLLTCAGSPALAAPKYLMPEASRTIEGGRGAQVLVAQSEIKSNINGSYVSVATGGGLIGALIDAKIEADRAKRAEAVIVPVRDGLVGLDVDALALETTKAILAGSPWLGGAEPVFSRDNSLLNRSGMLDSATAKQVVFFDYVYDLSPDFSAIRVMVTIQVADKALPAGKKPQTRLYPRALIYSQTLTAVVSLHNPSKELEANAGVWAANDAVLARQAIALGFKDLVGLSQRAFDLTAIQDKSMVKRDKKIVSYGGVSGWQQENDADSTLVYSYARGLVRVRVLAE